MKKLNLVFMVVALFALTPMSLKALTATEPVSAPANAPATVESNVLVTRLAEIKAMDKSKLSAPEKKQLRKELRSMKKSLNIQNGGVYLSVGSIIIIVLLLILLL